MKKIIIIGAGMGGLATGIYAQRNGFDTAVFEAHDKPGGQCTAWKRKGYVFDACIHYFGAGGPGTMVDAFWRELGVSPCEKVEIKEAVSAVFPDGTYVHDYYNLEKLETHLKQLAPEDSVVIDEYIDGIRRLLKNDTIGALFLGSLGQKLSVVPVLLGLLKYFKHTLGSFAERFKNPILRRAFPLLHSSIREFPLFLHLIKHAVVVRDGIAWPKGGSLPVAENMAARYLQSGGIINYGKKVVKILTNNNRACGVELENGTQHRADVIVSNADGRKTILQLLSGRYVNSKISQYCESDPDKDCPFSVMVFLGVKRDLSAYPSALIMFLDKPEVIGAHTCDHLDLQIYGCDASMAPPGKGVIKIELFSRPFYFSRLYGDKRAYRAEKNRIAEQVIALLEKRFPGLREDVEVTDVATLYTWERYMGGTLGHNNFPQKKFSFLGDVVGLNNRYTLPGLKNFFFVGQWATSAGALFINALSGKTVVQKICRQYGVKIV